MEKTFAIDSTKPEILHDLPPWIRVYKDGTVERLSGYEVTPPGFDPRTGVLSKDILVVPETGVSARIYRPNIISDGQKLPLVMYFHGGAYMISSPWDPAYHTSLNNLVAESKVIAVSIDYRKAPEHPLPTAFEDAWDALKWTALHASGLTSSEPWLVNNVDFSRVYLAGDSAGANIAHQLVIRSSRDQEIVGSLKLIGLILINPYYWGEEPIGAEVTDTFRKALVDQWWGFVCPSDKGNEDPLVNPFAEGAPDLKELGCDKVVVCVAEKDILRDRGVVFYESLMKSGWKGRGKLMDIKGEDHVFHIFNPDSEKARNMIKGLADFIQN